MAKMMADTCNDDLLFYQFIDPSLLTPSSSDGARSHSSDSSCLDNARAIHYEHSFVLNRGLPHDEEAIFFSSSYNSFSSASSTLDAMEASLSSLSCSFTAPSNTCLGQHLSICMQRHCPRVVRYLGNDSDSFSLPPGSLALDKIPNNAPRYPCKYPEDIVALLPAQPPRSDTPSLNPRNRLFHQKHENLHLDAVSGRRSGILHLVDQQQVDCALGGTSSSLVERERIEQADEGTTDLAHSIEEQDSGFVSTACRQTNLKAALEEWYNSHRDNPYPSRDEKLILASTSGKSVAQVSTWFSNKRSREREVHDPNKFMSDCSREIYSSYGQEYRLFEPAEANLNLLNSPLVAVDDFGCTTQRLRSKSRSSNTAYRPRRKGRRRSFIHEPSTSSRQISTQPDNLQLIVWPCTRCRKESKNFYEWKRHEATHVTGAWICMPENTPIVNDCCAVCGAHDPHVSHLRAHLNLNACVALPLSERSFARKDKLKEHIHRIHLGKNSQPDRKGQIVTNCSLLDRWKREPATRGALWCGFCKMYCSSWTERQGHVGAHLQKGLDIALWESFS